MTEPEYCIFQVYRATLETPAEYCPNEAEPGEEYCIEHLPYEWEGWELDPDDDDFWTDHEGDTE